MEIKRSISPIGVVAAAVLIALARPGRDLFGDPGSGWHLLNGVRLLGGADVVGPEPFSFGLTPPGKIWIADQWLGDLVFGSVYHLLGWGGLQMFVAAVIAAAFFLLPGRKLSSNLTDLIPLLLALTLAGSLGSVQWFFRPVIFSFLCFSTLIFLISPAESVPAGAATGRVPRSLARLIKIALLFILWCNLHPGFFIGLLYLFLRLFDKPLAGTKGRRYERAIDLAVAAISSGVNPFGFELHRQALSLARSQYFTQLNEEWLPPDLWSSPYLLIVPIAVLIGVPVLLRDRTRIARADIAISLLLLCLSIQQRRYSPLAAIAAIRPLTLVFAEFSIRLGDSARLIRRIGGRLAAAERNGRGWPVFFLAMAGLLGRPLISGGESANQPPPLERAGFSEPMREAVRSVSHRCEQRHGPCRVWGSPDYGGLILWWLYRDPGVRVFIDDRNQVYGEDRYREYFAAAGAAPGWSENLSANGIDLVYLNGSSPLRRALEIDSSWIVLYQELAQPAAADPERGAILFFRKEPNDESK